MSRKVLWIVCANVNCGHTFATLDAQKRYCCKSCYSKAKVKRWKGISTLSTESKCGNLQE